MGLLSIDISKVKRPSLRSVKLPTKEVKVEPILKDIPPTDEDIIYTKLLTTNPILEEAVERLGLVSAKTGQYLNKVEVKEESKPHPEVKPKPKKAKKLTVIALAQKVMNKQSNYSKQEIIERIKETTEVDIEEAERGFNLILKSGSIEATPGGRFYFLKASSPF